MLAPDERFVEGTVIHVAAHWLTNRVTLIAGLSDLVCESRHVARATSRAIYYTTEMKRTNIEVVCPLKPLWSGFVLSALELSRTEGIDSCTVS